MREVELKGVVPDWGAAITRLERAGAELRFAGRLEDRRYDRPDRLLATEDVVLRLRVYRRRDEVRAELGWKGAASYDRGYKVREELLAPTSDPKALDEILLRLGYVVTLALDRQIAQYLLHGAMVRLERYPRMDDLVEVEGAPEAIERAIETLLIPRREFTTERLPQFVLRYQQRTGQMAALSDAELAGTIHYSLDDA